MRVWEEKGDVMEGVYLGAHGEEMFGMSISEQLQCVGFISPDDI